MLLNNIFFSCSLLLCFCFIHFFSFSFNSSYYDDNYLLPINDVLKFKVVNFKIYNVKKIVKDTRKKYALIIKI